MQYVTIKIENRNGNEIYVVRAIPLKNTNNSVVQKIPHPLGSDFLEFSSLEEAKDAVLRSGFSYILPDGERGSKSITVAKSGSEDYSQIVFEKLKSKVNSSNVSVSSAAILAISEFSNKEVFNILFNKLGEDNDLVRKNAISGICRYGNLLTDRIIESLNSENWVSRNSALTCIINLAEAGGCDLEKFILPLIKACDDSNTIVQVSAINALSKVYARLAKSEG